MKEFHIEDRIFFNGLRAAGILTMALLFSLVIMLFWQALPILQKIGPKFFITNEWNPVTEEFGAVAFIFGTVVSSVLGLLIATPVSIGVALFLTEIVKGHLAKVIGFLIEMLAAVPSVVYGLWGIFVLAPLIRDQFETPMSEKFGTIFLFSGPPIGVGMFTAGVVLAIMITPTITTICREVFTAISRNQREAALAIGSTRWEMMRISVLSASKTGIFGAVVLGLGRAIGETMAVTMVIGNRNDISFSLFAPGQTMSSIIANEYAEAQSGAHLAALSAIGFALFFVALVINMVARFVILRVGGPSK